MCLTLYQEYRIIQVPVLDQSVDLAEEFVRLTLFRWFFFRREFFVRKVYIVTDLFMVLKNHIAHQMIGYDHIVAFHHVG